MERALAGDELGDGRDVEKREGSEMNFSKELRVVVESL